MRTRDRGPDENLGIDTNVQKKKKKKGKGFINRFLVRETRNHFRYFKPRAIEYRGLSRKAGGRLGEQRGGRWCQTGTGRAGSWGHVPAGKFWTLKASHCLSSSVAFLIFVVPVSTG